MVENTSPVSLQSEHKHVLPTYWKVMNIPFVCMVIIQKNITLFYRELVLKTFLHCLYVTVVNFSMELIMNRSHRFLQSVITVLTWFCINIQQKKLPVFNLLVQIACPCLRNYLQNIFFYYFSLMKFSLLLFISLSLYKYQLSDGFLCEIHIVV